MLDKSFTNLLFDNKTFKILAISAYKNLNIRQFIKVLEFCRNVIFRYAIISKRNPKNMEIIFSQIAIKISKKEITKSNEIIEAIKPIYINDKEFVSNFNSVTIKTFNSKNKNTIKYILAQIEKNNGYPIDYKDSSITLEHILPDSPTESWIQIFGKDYQDYIYKIANFILLHKSINKTAKNDSFLQKKQLYFSKENLKSNEIKYFENIQKWDIEELEKRSNIMANKAKSIWKISGLK